MPEQHLHTRTPSREDPHLAEDDEHFAPAVTTPQGTQAYAVDGGYEERDVNLKAVVGWFAGLSVATFVIIVALGATFRLMVSYQEKQRPVPSPIFAAPQVPPEPRLIPNPVGFKVSETQPLPNPIDVHNEEKQREDAELAKLGLIDPATGLPRLPEQIIRSVATAQPPGGGGHAAPVEHGAAAEHGAAGTGQADHVAAGPTDLPPYQEPLPSDSSGGLKTENGLR
jgi:hypothetical protein